jgi:hypothetical protein
VFSTLIYSLIKLGRLLSIRQGNFGLLVQVTGRKFECEKGWTALLYMRNYPRPQLSLQRNYKFSLVGLCNEFLDADEIVYSTMEKKTRFDNLIFPSVIAQTKESSGVDTCDLRLLLFIMSIRENVLCKKKKNAGSCPILG